jgi:two-component system sensor histidine kinase PhoQ
MLLGVATVDPTTGLALPDSPPEVRFSTPGSGLYARVVDSDGNLVWRSPSTLGLDLPPLQQAGPPGQSRFREVSHSEDLQLFTLDMSVSWEVAPDTYRLYSFEVSENKQGFDQQLISFRRDLWGWLLGAALVLLLVQGTILRWSLKPLRQVADEVLEVETGKRKQLSSAYPEELQSLTQNLNALVRRSQGHLERYRNALADLAHSLKTPLAVLQNVTGNKLLPPEVCITLQEQLERMNRTVDYQLQRAAASGRIALTAPIRIEPVARKIVEALSKVYAHKALKIQRYVTKQSIFYGEEGDLMEILGNLADNACKWAHHRIEIRAHPFRTATQQSGLVMEVEDDGPGIPESKKEAILERGERADRNNSGHGIGLAVVRDIVEEVYQGTLEIGSGILGGACIRVRLQWS